MKRLADLINVSVDSEVLRAARAQKVSRQWQDVVGELLSTKSLPDRYENGILMIKATSTTWAQELRMREDAIVSRLNEIAQEKGLFTGIRVGVGPRRKDLIE